MKSQPDRADARHNSMSKYVRPWCLCVCFAAHSLLHVGGMAIEVGVPDLVSKMLGAVVFVHVSRSILCVGLVGGMLGVFVLGHGIVLEPLCLLVFVTISSHGLHFNHQNVNYVATPLM